MGETLVLEDAKEQDEFSLIEEDTILEAKVTQVKKVTTKMIDEHTGEPVQQYEFTFAIQDEPYFEQKRKLWGKTSTKFVRHEKCRLYSWVSEILAIDNLESGFKLDLDGLVGNPCRVVVEVNTWTDKKTDEEKSNNRVKEVIRSRGRRSAAAEEPFN